MRRRGTQLLLLFVVTAGTWLPSLFYSSFCFGQTSKVGEVDPSVQYKSEPVEEPKLLAFPKSIDSSSGEDIYSLLTSYLWSNRAPDFKHPFGFCPVGEGDFEYTFLASGSYEYRWIPLAGGDAVIKASGRWNLQPSVDKQWLACFDNGERHAVTLLENNSIQLDGYKYPKLELKRQPGAKSFAEMEEFTLPEEVKRRNAVLTSRVWHRANDVNLDRFPATIEFRPDFTYIARSASGREYPVGTWFATTETINSKGPRDPQGEGDYLKNYGAYLPVEVSNADKIIISNAPYVPSDSIRAKGTIHHFGGHGFPIQVQIEYDMPIRRGIPCRFDIHFTSAPNMILQRFSLTKEFEHGYRQPDGTITSVDELAAIDLGDSMLEEGKSKSFSIDVTFPESGDQWYYLNAMIKGASQNWDEREAVLFSVQDKR